jgi:nucleotide-binding universal stress UspA family protein
MQTIIVGVDHSETARKAAFAAAKIAAACCAPLHVVMAVNRGKSMDITVGGSDQWHLDWLSNAEQFLDALVGELPAAPVTRAVSLHDPATALCEEAERLEASMIVVGNRRGASRLLGAVAPTSPVAPVRCVDRHHHLSTAGRPAVSDYDPADVSPQRLVRRSVGTRGR